MTDLIKVTATEELRRQTKDSYILVDPELELELQHFKAMLTLASVSDMDLRLPANAKAADKAFTRAVLLLSQAIREWKWLDRQGKPYSDQPGDNPDIFESLTMSEVIWMLSSVLGVVTEEAVPEGS